MATLKDWIATHTGIPVEVQRIIYRGRVLDNSQRLCDAGIESDSVVFVVERGPPPPPARPEGQGRPPVPTDQASFAEWLEAHNSRMMDSFMHGIQQQFGARPQSPADRAAGQQQASANPDALTGLSEFLTEVERGSRVPEGLPPISSMTNGK